MNPKILIHYTSDLNSDKNSLCINARKLYSCEIFILTDGNRFRCLKNRYGYIYEDEVIPNNLMTAYLMRHESEFSKQDLIDALVYETIS
jgi:hypothetical protein